MNTICQQQGVQQKIVDESHTAVRLDNFLLGTLKKVPRSLIYRIIRSGEVRVNKGRKAASYRLQVGDVVRIPPLQLLPPKRPASINNDFTQTMRAAILYEDGAIMVINKPAGMLVHAGSGAAQGLIEKLQVAFALPDLELVHRLDKDTSGCLLLAKKRSALRKLHAALREGAMQKEYNCLVEGVWPAKKLKVDKPLLRIRSKEGEGRVIVSSEGKPSVTEFALIEQKGAAAWLGARPLTGRTHQIRVHAQSVGHPLMGDAKYGDRSQKIQFGKASLNRLYLHAKSLSFVHPVSEKRLTVEAPMPEDWQLAWQQLS